MRDSISDIIDDLIECGAPKHVAEMAVAGAFALGVKAAVFRQETMDDVAKMSVERQRFRLEKR